jgi:hypothetical protein
VKLGSVLEQPRKDLEIETPVHRNGPSEVAPVLVADQPRGVDYLNQDGDTGLLAELVSHAGADTPFTIGLFGPSGAGKSFFLDRLLAKVEQLTRDASKQIGKTPFLSRLVIAHVDVAAAPQGVTCAIAASVYDALLHAGADGISYAECADEAAQSTSDPHTTAREAADRVDALRHRLDGERQTLRDIEGRRVKLVETVLYEASGSRIDAYARTNRARIEQRLKVFGFSAGEPIENYKDLVRDIAEYGSALPSARIFFRAMWSYAPQFRLLLTAVVLALLGFGVGLAGAYRSDWIPKLWAMNNQLAPTGVFLESHYEWFFWGSWALYLLALACLSLNVWRALRFANPIVTGVSLLQADVAQRRADLDSQHSHQNRRVESLVAESDRLAQRAEEAERRALAVGDPARKSANIFVGNETPEIAARKFLKAVSDAIKSDASPPKPSSQPQRLVVALDNCDALPAPLAAKALISAHACLAYPGFVSIATIDRERLLRGLSELGNGPEWLEKLLQIPFDLAAASSLASLSGPLMARLLGDPAPDADRQPIAVASSRLDQPWSEADRVLLRALAALAGASVRSTKRFANLARLGRAQLAGATEGPAHFASLALALALDAGGTHDEIAGLERALHNADLSLPPDIPAHIPRLSAALEAAKDHAGSPLTSGDLRRGRDFAKRYAVRADP